MMFVSIRSLGSKALTKKSIRDLLITILKTKAYRELKYIL